MVGVMLWQFKPNSIQLMKIFSFGKLLDTEQGVDLLSWQHFIGIKPCLLDQIINNTLHFR
jgi:hypothetical protein